MNLVKPKTISIKVKSINPLYIDFHGENDALNLDQVICFKKIELGVVGIPIEIPSIRFITSNPKHTFWYFKSIEERDECFNNLEKQAIVI